MLNNDNYNYRLRTFLSYQDLIQESDFALRKQSKQSRSRRSRAHTILLAVYQTSGFKAFIMYTIAASITKLGGIPLSAAAIINK